jgi:3-oxo-5alpha-steroid 4-dehydrogenase
MICPFISGVPCFKLRFCLGLSGLEHGGSESMGDMSTIAFSSIDGFAATVDVIVCGFGGAGGSAALEAAQSGAAVMILERASGSGGATAMSSAEMYLGGSGGTALQRDLGIEDSTENMIAYLEKSLEDRGDKEKIRLYAEGAADHFDWVESLGVNYKRALMLEREVVPLTDESLLFSGNERTSEFAAAAIPVPRGHVPSHEGDFGGQIFMRALTQAVERAGVDIHFDCWVQSLVIGNEGRVVGVGVRENNETRYYMARRGVVLTTGGFIMNKEMTRHYLPEVHRWAAPYGNPYDLGDGIRLGMAAGGAVANMDEAFLSFPLYPPAKLTNGIMINRQGDRFVNEDAYLARLGHYASLQTDQRVYLLVDHDDYDHPMYIERLDLVAVGDTVAEIETEAGFFPSGALQETVAYYNRFAAEGRDPKFHKSADWLKPLKAKPLALLDLSFASQTAVIMPGTKGPLTFSLGGLDTLSSGEVKHINGGVVAGLYAAGRASAGLPRTSKGYASGMSVGDATFFGRWAGRSAATHTPLERN